SERVVELTLSRDAGAGGSVLGVARDVTARARADARTRALIDVGRELSTARDLRRTLDDVCARVAAATPCELALVVGDDSRNTAGIVAASGLPAAAREHRFPRQAFGAGAGTRTFDAAATRRLPLLDELGVSSAAAVAIHWHGRQFGHLVLAARDGRVFDA